MKRVVKKEFPNPLMANQAQLGQAVTAARTQEGLRMADACLLCDISLQTLVDIEAGRNVGTTKLFQAIDGLGVSLFAAPKSLARKVQEEIVNIME